MEIHPKARRHGVDDYDIIHAVYYAIRAIELDDERTLLIGPDPAGRLLELIAVRINPDDEPTVIHAMPLRPTFFRYL
jgi:hypothetical protein